MFIGWLTCIPAVLLPHSLCRFTTANAPANRQMPIASVVSTNTKKNKETDILQKIILNVDFQKLFNNTMKITEFIKDDLFNLPKNQTEREDYKRFVFKTFDTYLEKLNELSVENRSFEDIHFSFNSIISRQNHLIKYIKQSLNDYYDGKPAKAYDSLIKGLNSNLKNFDELLNVRTFQKGDDFYRIRIHKANFPLSSEDFFHIPYNLRGKVKTQRFSIPGFPSLYLGTTIYVCWEELNRPNINDFQAVRLNAVEPLKIIDLSPPQKDEEDPYLLYKFLMIWPLIFSSSVKVRNYEDEFKPEYIIPQLLLQWVRERAEIDGICYQTTHIDFSNTLSEGEFLNVVLPVKENKSRGLCNSLKQKFEMTDSTSIQLNQCSTGGMTFISGDDETLRMKIKKIELIKDRTSPYSYSLFGDLESVLTSMKSKKIK